jgi:hypothetical protein
MSDVIKTDSGKTGMIIEKGPPGTEGQYNKAAKERLKKIKDNRKVQNNPKASGITKKKAKEQNKFLTGGDGQNFLKPVKSYKSGGSVKNTRRMNRLEELGRVDAEKAYTRKGKRNLKAEKKRIVRSLNSRGAAVRGHGKEIK